MKATISSRPPPSFRTAVLLTVVPLGAAGLIAVVTAKAGGEDRFGCQNGSRRGKEAKEAKGANVFRIPPSDFLSEFRPDSPDWA